MTQQPPDDRFDTGMESPTPIASEDRPESRVNGATSPDPFFPLTLETRKKKKKPVDSTDPVTEDAPRDQATPKPRNSGSKRKFVPEDDGFMSDPVPEEDEFQFSRPRHSPRKQSEPTEPVRQEPLSSTTPVTSEPRSIKPASTKRRVLEPSKNAVFLFSDRRVTIANLIPQRVQTPTWDHPRSLVPCNPRPRCSRLPGAMRTMSRCKSPRSC